MVNDTNGNTDNPRSRLPNRFEGQAGAHGTTHNLQKYLSMLWRQSWIIILTFIAVTGYGFHELGKITPRYRSTSKIYVERSGPKIMGDIERGVMTGSSNYLYTQAELLKASPILSEAIQMLNSRSLKTFGNMTNKIDFLRRSLHVAVGNKNDLISVSMLSPYPNEAAEIVNTVIEAYVDFHSLRKKSTAVEVLRILQQEKEKRGTELSERLRAMMEYKANNDELAFQTDSSNIIMERINAISGALTQSELQTLSIQSDYETALAQFEDPNKLADYFYGQQQRAANKSQGDNTQRSPLLAQLVDLRLLRATRLLELTPDHPAVIAVDDEIMIIEAEINTSNEEAAAAAKAMAIAAADASDSGLPDNTLVSLKKAYLVEKEQAYLAAKRQEEKLAELFEKQRAQAIQLNQKISQYAIFQQEWEQSRQICDILDNRIKELNVVEDVGVLNISILEVAVPARYASEPLRSAYMSRKMTMGLVFGVILGFLREMRDHRIRSAEEVTELLGVPLLGVVPGMPRKQSLSEKGREVQKEPHSSIAEAFRTIRTAVFFSIAKEQAPSIQITSAEAGDGKSTLASNLSTAMAQSGKRILLIDADLRHPTQHKIFETNRDDGLSTVLAGLKTFEQVLYHTEIEGLDLLVAGPDVPNPADMLSSPALKKLLNEQSNHYDRIIVDSPPIVPVADGGILATVCEASIFVVRAEKSSSKALQQARKILTSVGAHVMGCLVNGVKPGGHYGYGYGQGYYYSKHGNGNGNGHKKNGKKSKESPPVTRVSHFTKMCKEIVATKSRSTTKTGSQWLSKTE